MMHRLTTRVCTIPGAPARSAFFAPDGNGMAQNAMTDARQNMYLRTALLQTGLTQRKNLITQLGALGQTSRIKLFNVGILTSLRMYVTCPITIGTAIAVPSARAPWNLLNRVRVQDYDGTDRVNLSGFQLYVLNCIRRRQPFGWNNQQAAVAGAGVVTNPSIPTAVGSAVLSFWLEVPICINDNPWDGLNQDLTGAIYAQTGVGELYLVIEWNSLLYQNGNIDAVYSGAPTTTVVLNGVTGPTVQVFQNYIFPQKVGNGVPLPPIDLSSVYELAGAIRSTDNIAVNSEKLISFPNLRRVIGAYVNWYDNNTVSATNLNLLRILVNASSTMYENSQFAQVIEQRLILEGDIGASIYFWNFRNKPIETAIFGNVQLGITPNAVVSNPFAEFMFESIYTKGAALPGMIQSG